MKTVFIGGSRRISRLNDQIRSKLAEIIDRQLQILVGDANGADRAIQTQLAEWHYPHVTVYFVGSRPRNNEGAWPLLRVPTPKGLKGFDFYSVKDRQMAIEADCGMMLWDGESRGTLANVMNLVRDEKPVAVYISKQRRFVSARTPAEVDTLGIRSAEPSIAEAMQSELPLGIPRKPARKHRRRTA